MVGFLGITQGPFSGDGKYQIRRMSSRFRPFAIFAVFAAMASSGCLFRSHDVPPAPAPIALKNATKAELLSYINTEATKIQTMYAVLDIDTAVGGARKGKVTEYQRIGGFVWLRKPAMLRMQGLLPIIHSRAFDMVSDGQEFKLWIPPKNRFIVGHNEMAAPDPEHPLENLRPQVIYDALLLREINNDEATLLDNSGQTIAGDKGRNYEEPAYIIDVIRGQWPNVSLSRKIIFSRIDLLPNRQLLYDGSGRIVTDVRYSNYKDFDTARLPAHIEIWRPEEEYDITLTVETMDVNRPIGDDKFVLERTQGVQVIDLDDKNSAPHVKN